MDCFACSPSRGLPDETAWEWSQARPLCHEHADRLAFAGEPLFELLRRCDARDAYGQGSPQNRLINPATLDVDGTSLRVWVGSAAGALFPMEDRFSASDSFEWAAFETSAIVDLLHSIRLLVADGDARVATDSPLLLAIAAATRARPPTTGTDRGASAGYERAVLFWNWQLAIDALRARVGPGAPADAQELRAWADACGAPHATTPEAGSGARFVAALVDLSQRRFPNAPASGQ